MKFEEILPALRNGKKIRKSCWLEGEYINLYGICIRNENGNKYSLYWADIIEENWELYEEPKQKVKYYPALVKCNTQEYMVSVQKFKDEKEAEETNGMFTTFVRLVTEIPELIEERDE